MGGVGGVEEVGGELGGVGSLLYNQLVGGGWGEEGKEGERGEKGGRSGEFTEESNHAPNSTIPRGRRSHPSVLYQPLSSNIADVLMDPAVPKSVTEKVTTIEYDVVACQDFLEDHGRWVRNMPEEIRLANPDFVPT